MKPGELPAQTPESRIATLERKLAARDKTIAALIERQLVSRAQVPSAMNLLEQNLALEKVVGRKTRELATALAELQQTQVHLLQARKLEAIGQMAAGIAHEINTPTQFVADNNTFLRGALPPLFRLLESALALVREPHPEGLALDRGAALERLLEQADLDFLREQVPIALEQSAEGLARIASIVKAMKDFAHSSGGVIQPENLASLIQAATLVARNEWKEVADLQLDFAPDLPPVPCLRDELGQVILNLVVNAAQAIGERMAQGRPERGHISISARPLGAVVEVRVRDDGTGIPEHLRDRVFDPFFTTKAVGRGTGQGLAIVYAIVVEHHQGQLQLESEVGRGTCFVLRLPLAQTEA